MKTSLPKLLSAFICLLLALSTFSQTPATALKFDPSLTPDDNSRLNYVSVNSPFRAFQKEITVEFWMNTPEANLQFGSVMGQGTSNEDENWVWLMHPDRNGKMTFYIVYNGGFKTVTCNIRPNEWHHYAATASATSTKFYVDGVKVDETDGVPANILSNSSSVIHIGKDVRYATRNVGNDDPTNRYAPMTIDELRIWSRALCAEEINANKNVEINPTGQNGLQQYYRFNQGFVGANNSTVTTLTDLSGNNRNGTLNNFTLNGTSSNWAASGSTNTGIVNAFVPPTAAIQGGANICIGQSRTLTNTIPGGSWTSSNTGVATINATTGQVTTVSAGTATITYTTACGGVSTLNITINPLPTVSISGTTIICSGSSTTLTASGGNSYSWNTNATTAAITVSPTVNTNYTVTGTSAAGCSAQATSMVTVNAKPVVTASSNSPVSAGNNLQLSANGALNYVWSGPNGFSSSLQNPIINNPTASAGGTYTVTGTSLLGCSNTASVNVTVLSTPATALKTDGVDDYVTISNPFRSFDKAITVEFWMNTPTGKLAQGSIMGQSSLNVDGMGTDVWLMHPDIGGTNLDFYVNDAGTWRRATVPIIAGGWHHYVGVASEFGIKFYVDGVLKKTEAGISTGILSNANAIMQIGKDPRHTNFRFADMTIDEVRVWSRALCEAEIINNKNCEINPAGQTGLQEYYRFNQGFVGANNSTEITLTDLSGNNRHGALSGFALTGNNSNWVQSGFVSTANCSPYVAPVSPITGTTSLCIGSNTTLANANAGGLWSSSNTAVATINANTGVVNALTAGTTTITYRTECGGVSTATLTVNAFPVATIAGTNTICSGTSTTLAASGGATYLWNTGATAAAITVSPSTTTTYSVTVTSAAGCVSTANRTVTVITRPTVTASSNSPIVAGNNLQLSSSGATTYSWTGPNGFTSGVQNPVITGTTTAASGVYTVTGINASGCSNTTTVNVTVQAKPATALNTDGVNDYVAVNNPFRAFNKEITVEFWMNTPNAIMPYGSVMGQATSGVDNMSTNVWLMHPDTKGNIDFLVNDAGTWRGATVPIKAGGWHHYVGVASEFGTKFYVDGVLEATGPAISTGIVNNANSVIHIGKDVRHNTGRFGDITIDEVRIWSRVLCEGEINNSRNCELNPSGLTGLQQYYRFNQGYEGANNNMETTLVDASGNGRNGQLNDFALTGANSNWTASGSTNTGTCASYTPPTAPITGVTYICIGTTGTLSNAISGGLWSSSNPNVATINANTGLVTSVSGGTTTITYKNECGGVSTTTVTIVDLPTPTITSPVGGINVCPGNTVTLSVPPSGVAIFYQWYKDGVAISGATTRIYTATVSGNYTTARTSGSCISPQSNIITVSIADAVKPSITCPPSQTIELDATCKATLPDYRSLLTASDNCTPAGSLTITQSPAAGTIIEKRGALVITFTVTDASGNNSTCTMGVDKLDKTAPVITCPAPITVNNATNTCGAVVNFARPTATDNCSGPAFNFWNSSEPNNANTAREDYLELMANGRWNDLPNSSSLRSIVEFNTVISTSFTGYNRMGVYEGHTYYLSTASATWTNSRTAAQTIGGDLVSINTIGENDFLKNYLTTTFGTNGIATWAGGYQDINDPEYAEPGNASQNFGGWKWADGTKLGAGQITITQTAGLPSGSVFPVGVTTNTFIARDESGNENTCSFTVTVRDIQAPAITCPSNITVTATSAAGAVVNYVAPVGTDNCAGATTVRIAGPASGSTFPIGTTTVTHRVTDAAGLSTECSFTVTVSGLAPVIVSPGNQTVNVAPGTCAAVVNFAATETTGIPASTITYSIASGSTFAVGSTVVTATATNAVGSSSVEFTVRVVDNEKPVITTCPPNQTIDLDASCKATLPDYRSLLTASDNCTATGSLVITQSPAAGTIITTKGSMIITFTVTDASNNSSTCTITLDKKDVTAPVITCREPISVNATSNTCGAVVNFINPTATDNCTEGAFTFFFNGEPNQFQGVNEDYIQLYTNGTWNDLPNSSANRSIVEFNDIRSNVYAGYERIGTYGGHTYYLSTAGATWVSSRSAAQAIGGDLASINTKGESEFLGSFIATKNTNAWVGGYQDKTVPGFQEPGNASQNYLGWKWVDGTQLGAGQITITQTAGLPSGSVFPVGVTTNTFIARDESGNESTCSFTVTVRDVQPPVINCPANISVTATSAAGAVVNYTTPVGTDNCSGATTTRIAGLASGSTFPIGTTTVTYRVTDAAGLSTQCSFTVTVVGVAPVITCPANITVNAAAGTCAANVNFTATETVGIPASTITYTINGNPVVSGASFPVGTTTVVATATNAVGSSSCSFTVTVVDNQNPSITAPVNVQGNNTAGLCTGTVTLGTPVTADNCGVASVTNDAPSTFPVGTTTVTWTVTDVNGNKATATQTVVITDNEKPSITAPANVQGNNTAGLCTGTVTLGTPITADNCGVASVDSDAPATFPVGTTIVTWTVTDIHGNTNTATQNVVIVDNEKPTISTSDVSVNNDPSKCGATIAIAEPTTADNCGVHAVMGIRSDDALLTADYPVGTTTITWTVRDIHGNTNTTTQTVIVNDTELPVVKTQNIIVQLGANGQASITASQINNGSTDNCAIATVVLDKVNFNCSNVGENTVLLTVTDIHGNSASANATVTVQDNIRPTVITQAVTVTLVNGSASVTAAQVNNGSFDNCGIATMTVSPANFNCNNIGSNTVILTVTDVNGNTNTASAIVTVVGQLPSCSITSVPTSNVFTGGNPNNIYLGYGAQSTVLNVAATGGSSYTYQWSGTATQMLSSTTAAAPVFTPTAPGNYTFTVTVTNNFGCTSTCSITICVKDIRVPGTGLKGSPAKVYICHVPPGNKNNPQTLEISVNAVATHIGQHSGDRLGTCAMTPCPEPAPATAANALISKATIASESNTDTNEDLKVTVMPNPSATYFTLKLESKYDAPVNMKVVDVLGRVVDNRVKLGSNATVQVGHNYQSGTYFAEFIQGNRRKVVQLLKIKR